MQVDSERLSGWDPFRCQLSRPVLSYRARQTLHKSIINDNFMLTQALDLSINIVIKNDSFLLTLEGLAHDAAEV